MHLKRLVSVVVSAAALAYCVCLGTVGAAVQPRNATAFGNLGTPVPQPTSASSLPTILNAAAYEVITGPLDGEVIYADVFVHWVPVLVNGSTPTSYVVCTSDFLAPGFPNGGGCWSLTNTAFKVQGFRSMNGASVPSFEIYATTSDGVLDLGSITPNIINGWTGSNFGSETLTPQIGTITAAFAGGSLHLAWTHSSYGIADQYSIPSSYSIKVCQVVSLYFVPQCTTSTSNSDSADIPNLPNLDNSVELTVEVAGTNAYGTGDKSSVGQIVGTPPVTLLTTGVSNKQISVSWKSPSEFTPSDPASNPSGSTVTLCATASSGVCKVLNTTATSVVFSQLNTSTQYSVSVRAINQYGTSAPAASNADFPVSAKNLTIQNLSQTSNGMVNLVAYGVYPGLSVTLGISGHKQHCTADPAGECTVSFTLAKPGAYGILATLGTQTATSESWFPSISTPSSVKHGSPFPVTIGYGAKGAPVVVTTSDGKTYTGKVGGSGSAVVMVPTTTPKFLTLNFTVGGVSFPARKVQVS